MMTPEEKIVLLFSRVNPSRAAKEEAESILSEQERSVDYSMLTRLASMNEVTQLLYHNLKTGNLLPAVTAETGVGRIRETFFWTVRDNAVKARETLRIMGLLKAVNVDSIALKGALASDIILGNPGVYSSSDIDILVKPSDLERAKRSLADSGYSAVGQTDEKDILRNTYHLSLSNGVYTVEVHWTLAFRYFEIPWDFWWEEIGTVKYNGTEMPVLSNERYILYTIFRLYNKAFRPLKFFVLPAEIINKYHENIDWGKLLDFAKKYRMRRLALFALRLLHDLLGADVPADVAGEKVRGYEFLKRLVLKGLFSDVSRTHVRMLAFTSLQDTLFDTVGVILKRSFPDKGEIRMRYRLSGQSKKVYLYYILNPFLLLFNGKTSMYNRGESDSERIPRGLPRG